MKNYTILAALALLLAGCCCPPPSSKTERTEKPTVAAVETSAAPVKAKKPAKPEPPKVDAMLTAAKLHKEYNANEVRADSKYKGKRLAVAGRVESIDKDFMGDIVLKLKAGNGFLDTVSADLLDAEKSKAMDLSKGDKVFLLCTGGTMVMNMPTLRKCSMISENTKLLVRE
jgi:PBP1b-binding outer membrane lipoprotein LpoB